MATSEIDQSRAPLLRHLTELRRRLLTCVSMFVVAFACAWFVAEDIYAFLLRPLIDPYGSVEGRRMIFTGLPEAFFTYIKLSFFAAACVSIPLVLIQVWKFLAPGFYLHEKRSLLPAFVATPLLFTLGAALAYYVVFPLAWRFFLSFESSGASAAIPVELEARVAEYLSLVTGLVLAFGITFELPVALMVLAKVGFVTTDGLRSCRKHAVVLIFFVAALVTPPDLVSQIALGLPLVLLYEFSIWLIVWSRSDSLGRERAAVGRPDGI